MPLVHGVAFYIYISVDLPYKCIYISIYFHAYMKSPKAIAKRRLEIYIILDTNLKQTYYGSYTKP